MVATREREARETASGAEKRASPKISEKTARQADAQFKRERARQEVERWREEAKRAREQERREQAIAKARSALDKARKGHEAKVKLSMPSARRSTSAPRMSRPVGIDRAKSWRPLCGERASER